MLGFMMFYGFDKLWYVLTHNFQSVSDSQDITLTDFHLNFVDSLEDVSMEGHQAMLHHPTMGYLAALAADEIFDF